MTDRNLFSCPIVYVIGALRQFKYDGDFFDWLYLSMRWLPIVRPCDLVVLPDLWPVREYVAFLEETLWPGQHLSVQWVSAGHYLLDDALDHDIPAQRRIRSFLEDGAKLVTYSADSRQASWFQNVACDSRFFGETAEWCVRFATKAVLHPWASTPDTPSLAEANGIPVLAGYNASNYPDLCHAWDLLREKGVSDVGIKPLRGVFGDGIMSLAGQSESEVHAAIRAYDFPQGPVALEQWVTIDADAQGEVSWSTHYWANQLFGPPTRQIVDHRTSGGNVTPGFDAETAARLEVMTSRFVDVMRPQGMGGFNGPIVQGRPYVTDVNTGRITGVFSSLIFREMFCPGRTTLNRKMGKPCLDLRVAWQRLREEGLAFDPDNARGVFVQAWIPSAWSQIIACGEGPEEVVEMLQRTKSVFGA